MRPLVLVIYPSPHRFMSAGAMRLGNGPRSTDISSRGLEDDMPESVIRGEYIPQLTHFVTFVAMAEHAGSGCSGEGCPDAVAVPARLISGRR